MTMKTNIVKAALFTPLSRGRWGLPVLLWGDPGVAKSAILEGMCARWGLPCEVLSPGERGEGAFGVVPVPEGKGATMTLRNPRPDWCAQFDATGRGVVFVDEMTTAPPALQPPLLGLLLARRIGGYQLPAGVRVLGAANPPETAAAGYDLAAPVANRVGHVTWPAPSVEDHIEYMLSGEAGDSSEAAPAGSAADEEARVLAAWPDSWARARGLEASFLRRFPDLKNKMPRGDGGDVNRAWPSDRSWEAATRAYASAAVHGLTPTEQEEFVGAFVGDGPAGQLFNYAQELDLPDPADVLDGKVRFKHSGKRIDRTAAVLTSCAALVTPKAAKDRDTRSIAMWELCNTIAEQKADLDILVPVCKVLVTAGLIRVGKGVDTMSAIADVVAAAGVDLGAV
jgi:MoxR-like ATPase